MHHQLHCDGEILLNRQGPTTLEEEEFFKMTHDIIHNNRTA